jgi:hypothetical protein
VNITRLADRAAFELVAAWHRAAAVLLDAASRHMCRHSAHDLERVGVTWDGAQGTELWVCARVDCPGAEQYAVISERG